MTNIDKVSKALSGWAFDIASAILPKYQIPQGSAIGNIMQGFLGINPATYNVWKELGFIAEPMIELFVTPAVTKMMAGMPEDRIKEIADKFVESFMKKAKEEGGVNLFGIMIDSSDLEKLRSLIDKEFAE